MTTETHSDTTAAMAVKAAETAETPSPAEVARTPAEAPQPPTEIAPLEPPALDRFVEEMAVLLEAEGLPRIAGRIFAYLLVCQPPEQTAADLARALHASVGSISTMTRLLIGPELVERVSRAGHRADRFRITADGLSNLASFGPVRLSRIRRQMERGLDLIADRPAADRARLEELYSLYLFLEERLPALLAEWNRTRTEGSR